ncbi:MAG: protein-export chaperone SecB [Balneolaceae bacterium]|nr:protein-export chaperone SecB [Balneolaceae bacterium]
MNSPIHFKRYEILKINFCHDRPEEKADISFHIPQPEPVIKVNPDNRNEFIVKLNSKILPDPEIKDSICPLTLEFELVGFFEIHGELDSDEKHFHMTVSAPSMLFGIVRSWVSQITAGSGMPPILLPSVQFGGKKEKEEIIDDSLSD